MYLIILININRHYLFQHLPPPLPLTTTPIPYHSTTNLRPFIDGAHLTDIKYYIPNYIYIYIFSTHALL